MTRNWYNQNQMPALKPKNQIGKMVNITNIYIQSVTLFNDILDKVTFTNGGKSHLYIVWKFNTIVFYRL